MALQLPGVRNGGGKHAVLLENPVKFGKVKSDHDTYGYLY